MPFIYVPLRTHLPLEEKRELGKMNEFYKNLKNKDFDLISWFENDLETDLKSLEKIAERVSNEQGKILGKLEYIKREVKSLKEKRDRLILDNYLSFYYSEAKEIFESFYDFLSYLTNFFDNLT